MPPLARLSLVLASLSTIVRGLHILDPITCSIPYLTPTAFATACDRTDEYYHTSAIVEDLEGNELTIEKPPPFTASIYIQRRPIVWTHEPWCLESTEAQHGFCVYVDALFARGRGLAIISTPRMMAEVAMAIPQIGQRAGLNMSIVTDGLDKMERKQMADRGGKYAVATTAMERGTRLLSASPTVWMLRMGNEHLLGQDQETLLNVALARLPADTVAWYRQQYSTPGALYPEFDRLEKNSFTARVGAEEYHFIATIPEAAVFNHDCRPNLLYHFNPHTLAHEMWVARPVAPGDELTVSYISPYDNSTTRAAKLQHQWNFTCACPLCRSSPAQLRASDRRLRIMSRLIDMLNVPFTRRGPDVRQARELHKLHLQEGLFGSIAGAEMYVAMEYMQKKAWIEAREWAAKARTSMRLWAGDGHPYYKGLERMLTQIDVEEGKNVGAVAESEEGKPDRETV